MSFDGDSTFVFDFGPGDIATYFDDTTGLFSRDVGDVAVVVNFGESLGNPPHLFSNLEINDDTTIHATLINTRFTGVTVSDRLDWQHWFGGGVRVQRITLEPFYGIGLICSDLINAPGPANLQLGTATWPALIYVTEDVDFGNANFELVGTLICLRNYNGNGGPDLTYDEGFLANLPAYLVDDWPGGVSGTLKIHYWKEVASLLP